MPRTRSTYPPELREQFEVGARARSPSPADVKAHLIETSLALIMEPGPVAKPPIRQLILRSGLRKGLFYREFRSEAHFYGQVLGHAAARTESRLMEVIRSHSGDHRTLLRNMVAEYSRLLGKWDISALRRLDLLKAFYATRDQAWSDALERLAAAYLDWLTCNGIAAIRIRDRDDAVRLLRALAFLVRNAYCTRLASYGTPRFVDWTVDALMAVSGDPDAHARAPSAADEEPDDARPPGRSGPGASHGVPADLRRAKYLEAGVQLLLEPSSLHKPAVGAVIGRACGDATEFRELFGDSYHEHLFMAATTLSVPGLMQLIECHQGPPRSLVFLLVNMYRQLLASWSPASLAKLDIIFIEDVALHHEYFHFVDDLIDAIFAYIARVPLIDMPTPSRFDCAMLFRFGAYMLRWNCTEPSAPDRSSDLVEWLTDAIMAVVMRTGSPAADPESA